MLLFILGFVAGFFVGLWKTEVVAAIKKGIAFIKAKLAKKPVV